MRYVELMSEAIEQSTPIQIEELISRYPGIENDANKAIEWMGVPSVHLELTEVDPSRYSCDKQALYTQFPHERKAVDKIAKLIKKGALRWPVFIDVPNHLLIYGQGRALAFQHLGMKMIPAVLMKPAVAEVPRFLYHGTFAANLSSIGKHGLDPKKGARNFTLSRSVAIYLNDSPKVAEYWARETELGPQTTTVVLRIDTSKLDPSLLRLDHNDGNNERGGQSYEYLGTIPLAAITLQSTD